jgi:hypothetical protein
VVVPTSGNFSLIAENFWPYLCKFFDNQSKLSKCLAVSVS